jgi:hypothetical protein
VLVRPNNRSAHPLQAARRLWSLHQGRSHKSILRVIPADDGVLYRIEWPDIAPSAPVNLTRAKAAALQWAEQKLLTDHRNLSVAQRLKLLNNFSWSSSLVRGIDSNGEFPLPEAKPTGALPNGGCLSSPNHPRRRRA